MDTEEKLVRIESAINTLADSQQKMIEVVNQMLEALETFVQAAKKAGIK